MVNRTRLYQSDHYVADLFVPDDPGSVLVCTFTERTNRELGGTGFAGDFLLKNSFSVLAIKTDLDHWYQDVPLRLWEDLDQFLESTEMQRYAVRSCYGSSMGGYAAIAFAARLGASNILAISPQVHLGAGLDERWPLPDIPSGPDFPGNFRNLSGRDLPAAGRLVVAYDPFDPDRMHVERLLHDVPPGARVERVLVNGSAHPSGYVLSETNLLKSIAFAVLSGRKIPDYRSDLRSSRRKSATYLYNMSHLCLQRRKFRWSREIIRLGLRLRSLDAEYHILASRAFMASSEHVSAIGHAATAVALNPDHPHMTAYLGETLFAAGLKLQAVSYMRAAMRLLPESEHFRQRLEAMEAAV